MRRGGIKIESEIRKPSRGRSSQSARRTPVFDARHVGRVGARQPAAAQLGARQRAHVPISLREEHYNCVSIQQYGSIQQRNLLLSNRNIK